MEDVLEIGVGAKFQERLADLVWKNCSELARQTAAGKMALALDSSSERIQNQVIKSLVPEIVNAIKGDVAEQVKTSLTGKILEEVAKNVVISITDGMRGTFSHLVEKEVTKAVRWQVDAAINKQFKKGNGSLAAHVRKRLDEIIDSEFNHRLRVNEAAQELLTEAIVKPHSELEPDGRETRHGD